ncbi:hypothetical protein AAF712_015120 [Marasmius tenuissimus]|uniref:Uncharacterized protein n=1 Tax=Marasmius tenuissimus TaxID=585030 RepID=A0ABR2ZAG0_9AGAR
MPRCTTEIYANGEKQSQVKGPLILKPVRQEDVEMETYLPDSTLSVCRRLDHGKRMEITQEISQDAQPLLYLVYDLERSSDYPEVQFVKHQRLPIKARPPLLPPLSTMQPPFQAQPLQDHLDMLSNKPETQAGHSTEIGKEAAESAVESTLGPPYPRKRSRSEVEVVYSGTTVPLLQ